MGTPSGKTLQFGTSPFILRTGEDKEARIKAGPVQRSNLAPEQGGVDVDDLESISGQSFAETVVVEDDDQ